MNGVGSIIRRFNRFELKYLLPLDTARGFQRELCAYLQPDDHMNGTGHYAISSLYYDSPDYRFYWEKVNGIKFRRKLRIRCYETRAPLLLDTPVFVEIKQRLDRVTQKRRVVLPYQDALLLCDQRTVPQHRPQDRAVVEEIHTMLWQYNLRPASMIRYLREAYVGTDYDVGLRVTFDTNLTYRAQDLCLDSKHAGAAMLPLDRVVMEIKVNERIPYWLTELVAEFNLRMIRVSKYCLSLEAAQKVPRAVYQIA